MKPYWQNEKQTAQIFWGDALDIIGEFDENHFDMIFVDPPYFLSNGGVTCFNGKMAPVDKGKWDISKGVKEDHDFVLKWLSLCKRVLKPNGTIWISGTHHIIYSVGYALQELGFKILNDIVWFKPNASPNLSCRYFTHSTEILLWATKDKHSRYTFNYKLLKALNNDRQMRNMWVIPPPKKNEKILGKHPTQKPEALLNLIILASTNEGDLILDPFLGSGTTGVVVLRNNRKFIGIEKEIQYIEMSIKRISNLSMISKGNICLGKNSPLQMEMNLKKLLSK